MSDAIHPIDQHLQPILGEAVGQLEAKGLKPKALLFSVVLDDDTAHQVGIEKAADTGSFNETMKALVDIAMHMRQSPERDRYFTEGMNKLLEEMPR